MKIDKELLKGSTNLLVLSLLEKEDLYGYQLIKRLKEQSNDVFDLKEGTLYPILHNLEEYNYIESYWDELNNRKRKYYKITKNGMEYLNFKVKEWQIFSGGINNVIGGILYGN